MSNHLGNVLATITDGKLWNDSLSRYLAEVASATDYEPFGLALDGRSLSGDAYRYGFNGKEDDGDFGSGMVDFGARVYNKLTGRWMACDPLEGKYPNISTYAFVANSPLVFIDIDGKRIVLGKNLTVEQKQLVLETLQQLTDDRLFIDPITNEIRIASLAESGSETKVHGTNLIRLINSSDLSVFIDMGNSEGKFDYNLRGNAAIETDKEKARNGEGSDAYINFSDEQATFIDSFGEYFVTNPETGLPERAKKGEKTTSAIGIGHELIHVMHMNLSEVKTHVIIGVVFLAKMIRNASICKLNQFLAVVSNLTSNALYASIQANRCSMTVLRL